MIRKCKDLSSEDQALWNHVARKVKPLDAEKRLPVKRSLPKNSGLSPRRHQPSAAFPFSSAPLSAPIKPLPSRRSHRVHKVALDGRLDLHGMTQDQARQQLTNFLASSRHRKYLWVLVITGKGRPDRSGTEFDNPRKTLRELVPQWLDDASLACMVSTYATARLCDGGRGALYVRLKKIPDFREGNFII
jgi:DNA-nicking Smr family endonuclease